MKKKIISVLFTFVLLLATGSCIAFINPHSDKNTEPVVGSSSSLYTNITASTLKIEVRGATYSYSFTGHSGILYSGSATFNPTYTLYGVSYVRYYVEHQATPGAAKTSFISASDFALDKTSTTGTVMGQAGSADAGYVMGTYPRTNYLGTKEVALSKFGIYTTYIEEGDGTTRSNDSSYYWEGNLVLNLDGGTAGSTTAVASSNYILPTLAQDHIPTKTDHSFDGFYYNNTKIYNADGSPAISAYEVPIFTTTFNLTAHYTALTSTLTINPNGGTWNGSSNSVNFTQAFYSQKFIEAPTKYGYTFNGWTVTGNGEISNGSLMEFDGVSTNYVKKLGRSQMYTDVITINVWANLDNWAQMSEKQMRLISCSEAGGWALYAKDNQMWFETNTNGSGYVKIFSTFDLNTIFGWHMWTATFDGKDTKLYMDGLLQKQFIGGSNDDKIIYNASNGIFIGAEAGASSSSPYAPLFKGSMQNVGIYHRALSKDSVLDLYNEGHENATFYYGDANSTITAQWSIKSSVGISVNANGGTWNGKDSSGFYAEPNKPVVVDNPIREGYIFKGWMLSHAVIGTTLSNMGTLEYNLIVKNSASIYTGIKAYDSYNTTEVYGSNTGLSIRSSVGPHNPGLGGFYYQGQYSYPNAEFYSIIIANIPEGYHLCYGSEETGKNPLDRWLTPVQGTGDYEVYVHYTKCGSEGSFKTTNYFYLNDNNDSDGIDNNAYINPKFVSWHVSNYATYNATGMNLNPDTYVANLGSPATFTLGTLQNNQTLIAMWQEDLWTRYAQQPTMNADGYYYVNKPEQLAWFAKVTKTQNLTAKIKLTADIDLTGHSWSPIGTSGKYFQNSSLNNNTACFDGQGYKVKNMYLPIKESYQGFFGSVNNNVEIKNLTVTGNIVNKGTSLCSYVGGIVGNGYLKIENCESYVDMDGNKPMLSYVGGILGSSSRAGSSTITNCINYGNLINTSGYSAGIVGYVDSYAKAKVLGCKNYGNISSSGEYTSGIIASSQDDIINCVNAGNVIGQTYVGGIAGQTVSNLTSYENCENMGSITATGDYVGGIAGYARVSPISNCNNSGKIIGNNYVGGIVGDVYMYGNEIKNCRNFGDVSGNESVGGIVGIVRNSSSNSYSTTIESCFSEGEIRGINNVGGIIGYLFYQYAYDKPTSIVNCGATGSIIYMGDTTAQSLGGLIGSVNIMDTTKITKFEIKDCFYYGSIIADFINSMNTAGFVGSGVDDFILAGMDSCYFSCNFQGQISKLIKRYTNGDFANFSFASGIMNGLPVNQLFWIGGVGGQNMLSYFSANNYERL